LRFVSRDFAATLKQSPEGWLKAMGIEVTLATENEVRAEMTTGPEHLQGYGIVHGGVHCGMIESLASIGAAIFAVSNRQHVVGLENNTSFIRAVRAGVRLRAIATPLTRGRKTQVWEARVIDEQDRLVATGRVRLLCLDEDQALAGEQVKGALHREKRG
jgi:1,4-dihydroxy-2-naphthoyl-CoA hydrolase